MSADPRWAKSTEDLLAAWWTDERGDQHDGIGSRAARHVLTVLADIGLLVGPYQVMTCPECGSTFDQQDGSVVDGER